MTSHEEKTIRLGLAYGMGAAQLAKHLDLLSFEMEYSHVAKAMKEAASATDHWKKVLIEPLEPADPMADFVPKSKEQERREQLARFPKNRKKMRY